jgi:hypothetical protein
MEEIELAEWNVRPISDLKGNDLHWSTVEEEQPFELKTLLRSQD